MVIHIDGRTLQSFVRYAVKNYPNEVIGILFAGKNGKVRIEKLHRARAGTDGSTSWVEVPAPGAIRRLERRRGKKAIGIVHSHPDASFTPSDTDLELLENRPDFLYFGIVSVIRSRKIATFPETFRCSIRFWRRLPKARVKIV